MFSILPSSIFCVFVNQIKLVLVLVLISPFTIDSRFVWRIYKDRRRPGVVQRLRNGSLESRRAGSQRFTEQIRSVPLAGAYCPDSPQRVL
jgi:hypothetical protein